FLLLCRFPSLPARRLGLRSAPLRWPPQLPTSRLPSPYFSGRLFEQHSLEQAPRKWGEGRREVGSWGGQRSGADRRQKRRAVKERRSEKNRRSRAAPRATPTRPSRTPVTMRLLLLPFLVALAAWVPSVWIGGWALD